MIDHITAQIHDMLGDLDLIIPAIEGFPGAPEQIAVIDFSSLVSWMHEYPTTAGPFKGGISGRGFTWYRLSVIHSDYAMILFANGRFYGVAPYDAQALLEHTTDVFEQQR